MAAQLTNGHGPSALEAEIKTLGDEIRRLKADKAEPALIKEKVDMMLAKKKLLAADEGDVASGSGKFVLKCAKGTRDYGPKEMAIRKKVLGTVVEAFERHGAETIDTPVFELRDVLLGKYGEEGGKLVYDLQDQGGEILSLRYDLTVPFARFLAMNKTQSLRRYQIAKVYRRDQPQMNRGRYREFYQCDFDIAGVYDSMLPESECLRLVDEVLTKLDVGRYVIKLNHRRILEGMFTAAGVPADQFKTVCSSVDKLDKVAWEDETDPKTGVVTRGVRNELVIEKLIDAATVDRLHGFVCLRSGGELASALNTVVLDRLTADTKQQSDVVKGVEELRLLLSYCEAYGIEERVQFDPSLARGLDYYTGTIYEVVVTESAVEGGVGSIAAGGRYDKLVEMFAPKLNVPCCGISLGIERIFALMEAKAKSEKLTIRSSETLVFVASPQKGLLLPRMKILRQLWDAGIAAEMAPKANPKFLTQTQYCEEQQIPLMIVVGQDELAAGKVKLREVVSRAELEVSLNELIEQVRTKLTSLAKTT